MPKVINKIDLFHGGLNSNSDWRDVADNELTEAVDVMVDELGKVRLLGGTAPHDAGSSTAVDIEPGYGLFQFSHDRIGGHLGEHLSEGDFTTHANWDVTGKCVDTGGNLTWTFGSGALDGTATQEYGDRLEAGIGGITYALTYTVAVTTAPDFFKLEITSFASAATALPFTAGTHTVTFTSHDDADETDFVITGTDDEGGTTSQGVFSIDNVSLYIYDAATTGDDYLVLADDESNDPAIYMYSKNEEAWSESQTISIGGNNSFAAAFYSVDGALRISDANFGLSNKNKWYGYIDRTWFSNVGGYQLDQWYSTDQEIAAPSASYFDEDWTTTTGESGDTFSLAASSWSGGGSGDLATEANRTGGSDIEADFTGGSRSIVRVVVVVEAKYTGYITYTLTAGPHDSAGGFENEQATSGSLYCPTSWSTDQNTHEFNYEHADTLTTSGWADGGGTDTFRAYFDFYNYPTIGNSSVRIKSVTLYEGSSTSFPALDSAGSFATGYVTGNNVCMLWDFLSDKTDTATTSGSWVPAQNEGKWMVGATFIYDDLQESQLTELVDEADTDKKYIDISSIHATDGGDNITVTARPGVLLAIADPNHDGAGDGSGLAWNKRITGCNIYMKDIYESTGNPWHLQYKANFITGKLLAISTNVEFDAGWHGDTDDQSYYYWQLPTTHSIAPANTVTYETNSGYNLEETNYVTGFKTAVVANRMAYVGNIKLDNGDVLGDAMVKSPVNKFDVFPLSRVIEASVKDGDQIVKLEEYADRILQFKKNKMHIINVSQQLEFLEDTFMYKGVSHPAAVCKTDFGIAWVNKQGCYLYDGEKVHNLFEKKGRQIIKESEWDSWLDTGDEPMIGYLPKKRQLIIRQDIGNGSNDGDIYLYDLVTQSWITGTAALQASAYVTNFVTDWNGDLVFAHTNGTVLKWSDAGQTSTTLDLKTKDIDFGHPGQAKKIYKVIITHRSAGSGKVRFWGEIMSRKATSGQGVGELSNDFEFGTLTQDSGVATNWITETFKPPAADISANALSLSNVYSIRLYIQAVGLGTGGVQTVPAGFEINDISIIYRLKNVR